MSPAPAAALLAALAAAALLADRVASVALIAAVLFAVCLFGPRGRRKLYLAGALFSGLAVFLVTPFVASVGWHVLWSGPTVPVLGQLDVTREELHNGRQSHDAVVRTVQTAGKTVAFSAPTRERNDRTGIRSWSLGSRPNGSIP